MAGEATQGQLEGAIVTFEISTRNFPAEMTYFFHSPPTTPVDLLARPRLREEHTPKEDKVP